jgi:hypothetical protein
MIKKFCNDRACALNADFTVCLQSEDNHTVLMGLRALMGEADFTAHFFSSEELWGAWLPLAEYDSSNLLEGRIKEVPVKTSHWVRLMVEDEKDHVILFDRTYHPNGDITEPVPAW